MPEVTKDFVRLPVKGGVRDGEEVRTITVGDAADGIEALYAPAAREIRTFLFRRDKWGEAEARKWVADHQNEDSLEIPAETLVHLARTLVDEAITGVTQGWTRVRNVRKTKVDGVSVGEFAGEDGGLRVFFTADYSAAKGVFNGDQISVGDGDADEAAAKLKRSGKPGHAIAEATHTHDSYGDAASFKRDVTKVLKELEIDCLTVHRQATTGPARVAAQRAYGILTKATQDINRLGESADDVHTGEEDGSPPPDEPGKAKDAGGAEVYADAGTSALKLRPRTVEDALREAGDPRNPRFKASSPSTKASYAGKFPVRIKQETMEDGSVENLRGDEFDVLRAEGDDGKTYVVVIGPDGRVFDRGTEGEVLARIGSINDPNGTRSRRNHE